MIPQVRDEHSAVHRGRTDSIPKQNVLNCKPITLLGQELSKTLRIARTDINPYVVLHLCNSCMGVPKNK